MTAIACIDGQLSALDAATVPVVDRGFLYGDAVFEALRTFAGIPDALDRHLARLERSCAIVGIALGVDRSVLYDEVLRAVAAVDSPERYVRIIVTRGSLPEALPPAGAGRARRVILVRPLSTGKPSELSLVRLRTAVAPPSPLWAGAKPTAYLTNLLAIAQAQAAGADDALLLGAHGELLEGATSSVFVVQGGQVLTPPIALGILPGITRDRVLACIGRLGLSARERLLTVHDAYRADELFLTSSVRGVAAVVELDGQRVGQGRPGPISERVFQSYFAELGSP